MPSPDEGSKKKKKKKRKNKDKEENEREEQPSGENVDEDSKPAVKKPTKEDPKRSSENQDIDIDVDELKNRYNETVQLNSSETSSQNEFRENLSGNPRNDICDKDSSNYTPSEIGVDMHRNIDKENVETCTDVNKQKHAEETYDTKDEGNM